MADHKKKAEDLKKQGNDVIKTKPEEAIRLYNEAIGLDQENHAIYGNRSLAFLKLERYTEALKDAERAIELKPDWSKGYVRKGAVLMCQSRYTEAEEAYRKALERDPDNEQIKQSLAEVEAKQMDVMNPFAARDVGDRLLASPKTKEYMKDGEFREKLKDLAKDPQNLSKYMGDKRVLVALSVLLDVDIPVEAVNSTSKDPLVEKPPAEGTSVPQPDLTGEAPPTEEKQRKEDLDEQGQATDLGESHQQALEEKEKGNAAYKMKDFETALAHYNKAFELDPTNITFLNNKAAVFFEQSDWEQCLKTCDEAVEKGREVRADFKLIAKALARMGNAYYKQEKWEEAVKYFDKSLAEHRNPDIVTKKNEAKKRLEEQQRLAYIDPQKSLEEKDKGNELFKKGDYPGAVQHYNEAIKRNPEDAKVYSNRAACYSKLMEPKLALKDCEECIRLDPTFIKGYVRKGNALLALKDTVKAMQAFEKALDIDPNNAEAKAGVSKCITSDDPEERRKRAMQDPEVQRILGDPAMQLILQQMQSNPAALRDHLKNPEIAAKLQKLVEAGFIGIR